jgi:hypothetical protein
MYKKLSIPNLNDLESSMQVQQNLTISVANK